MQKIASEAVARWEKQKYREVENDKAIARLVLLNNNLNRAVNERIAEMERLKLLLQACENNLRRQSQEIAALKVGANAWNDMLRTQSGLAIPAVIFASGTLVAFGVRAALRRATGDGFSFFGLDSLWFSSKTFWFGHRVLCDVTDMFRKVVVAVWHGLQSACAVFRLCCRAIRLFWSAVNWSMSSLWYVATSFWRCAAEFAHGVGYVFACVARGFTVLWSQFCSVLLHVWRGLSVMWLKFCSGLRSSTQGLSLLWCKIWELSVWLIQGMRTFWSKFCDVPALVRNGISATCLKVCAGCKSIGKGLGTLWPRICDVVVWPGRGLVMLWSNIYESFAWLGESAGGLWRTLWRGACAPGRRFGAGLGLIWDGATQLFSGVVAFCRGFDWMVSALGTCFLWPWRRLGML